MLATSDLDYELPRDRIATRAAEPRDSARMMVIRGQNRGHALVRDLPGFLRSGDVLVFNTTRVIPARLIGERADTGGRIEGLYIGDGKEPGTWVVMLKAHRMRPGIVVRIPAPDRGPCLELALRARDDAQPGAWLVGRSDRAPTRELLERFGRTPLPPYILAARKQAALEVADEEDRARYQTVYAADAGESVAAPTAGLHFTEGLLTQLATAGVERAEVMLDVGLGTFKPVESTFVEEHPIHEERCAMDAATIGRIAAARARGSRVIAVGTTSARTMESYAIAIEAGGEPPPTLDTRLLITPGYRWRWTDALLTNFHLPRSTLMALVAARIEGGVPVLKDHYHAAIAGGYRFYSYGDAMLVLS